ncbi:bifunctional 4-hydroxy-2-oxoglutarate aldolase/2-dehydro-3-deoxy-phosphogluconate aldolase [Actinomadura vinacea]|uniref:bifunctional 4-hydroxy-2-oxoglutarate aldolase/2-dehydro-3-deoxy-phosphogluconate aldolase n=1 Tax=Actinomadura vinacea TaxID=115336 RepID=UPI0031D93C8C
MPDDPLGAVRDQRLLPVLRTGTAEESIARARALLAAGCRAIELTTTTPGWDAALEAVAGLTDARGRTAVIGVGTVSTAAAAARALDLGAAFLVSPFPAPEVRRVAGERGATFIEGAFSPGELAAAAAAGPAKLFPAHVGGPSYLRSVRAVLPGSVIIPTGGIGPGQVGEWLDAGAAAVGVGSGLPADPAELAGLFARLEAAQ